MIRLAGYMGAALMASAPFFIDSDAGKLSAIVGLALLTVQAYNLRAVNLIALNICGIIGYTYALYI